MAETSGLLLVEALYTFRGKNNDELCFLKGDLITVTQREEGGWWEGTLVDKTGWFPSNYVREYKPQDGAPLSPLLIEEELLSPQHSQTQQVYRSLVLKDILESERSHLADLQNLLASHIGALRKSDLLAEAEYKQLVGNLEEVAVAHSNLVTALEEQSDRPSREQRIGGTFLTLAPHLQSVHQIYCSNHPLAVCILEKYKDELGSFMESQGAARPGIMFLTTTLSKPFRRLDKYTGMLQEYQRHLEEGHLDRGDTQRSSHVYKELASVCGALRRQKELELEVVTGQVHGWEGGESLGALGEVVRMGSVALLPDHRDRYFVLFPAMLVMLSVSPRMSAFIFEGSYPLSGINVIRLEDGDHHKNAFELSGPVLERVVAVCQSRQDQQQWVEVLTQQCRLARASSFTPHKSLLTSPPVLPAHVSVLPKAPPQSASFPCMSCGLPYYCGGGGGGVQKPSCSCSVSCPHALPSPPSRPYVSLPYVVLTKYLARHYRKKIITKKLLRQLAGDQEDVEAARHVRLRKHRTECSILTRSDSSSESDDETLQQHQLSSKSNQCSDSEDSSDSNLGYWVGGGPQPARGPQGFNVFSPLPSRKVYHTHAPDQPSSNLQKWRYQASPMAGSLSTSEESRDSSEGSNPYGYIRYFNPERPLSPSQDEEGPSRRFTYTQPSQEPSAMAQEEKSCSCNDFYNMPQDSWATQNLTSWGHHRQEHLPQQTSEDSQNDFPVESCKKVAECHVPRVIVPGHRSTNLPALTLSQSHPTLTLQHSEEDGGAIRVLPRAKTVHSSILTIPAAPMLLAGLSSPQRASECESSASSPNVCDKTIYEPSSSSCEGTDPDKVPWLSEGSEKRMFTFRTKQDIAYYVSSCSGEETGEDLADYYESHRKSEPLVLALSRSEPNLYFPTTKQHEAQHKGPKYSSHYVQLVFPMKGPATKVCNCEAHSHRSSDSGLADVVHHLEGCPLRTDTPGLGRGSGTSHSSQSSQLSSAKLLQSASWYPTRAFTPDSLFPTPVTSPNTSAPVSYAEDSLTSLLDSVSLHHAPAEQEARAEEGVYRSGLYAHWWMKASVCPRFLVLDQTKKEYPSSKVEKKPVVPPKPRFLKPSYHVRRGGSKDGVMKPMACSAATQTFPSHPPGDQCVHPRLKKLSSHLSPQTSLTMSRDRSFESQASQVSQVTVVPRVKRERESQAGSGTQPGVCRPQVLGKNSQESSGTDLSSLHSFSESCEGAGQQPHLRDSCEGLDVNFERRDSSHSLHTTATSTSASSAPYKSTLYWQLHPAHGRIPQPQSDCLPLQASSAVTFAGNFLSPTMVGGLQGLGRPNIPPKPAHLQSWPIQRSRSLPRLPVPSTFSVHTQSKGGPLMPRQASTTSAISLQDSPARFRRSAPGKVWSLSCLRPSPPLRPGLSLREEKRNQRYTKRKDDKWHEDDALILRVIEAYCTSAKTRYTVNSTLLDSPQVLIAEEEKIIVEETRGNEVVMEEKSLVDTVYALKDQVATLLREHQSLKKAFETEQLATRQLRSLVKQHLLPNRDDIVWDPEP
ncbi:Rho guanine nucleotide exchange factor 7 [Chionoecetes opilio]|uniref:Rho guanine nucleotide exchange factor 7 n=1 Tax=Chionoecetes opilio TaxID=41210 RepID=A0A8J4YGC5_CHIOP|nr:Rho guanine nucleotide exchange factor 7 [Chionoecetes opilio]